MDKLPSPSRRRVDTPAKPGPKPNYAKMEVVSRLELLGQTNKQILKEVDISEVTLAKWRRTDEYKAIKEAQQEELIRGNMKYVLNAMPKLVNHVVEKALEGDGRLARDLLKDWGVSGGVSSALGRDPDSKGSTSDQGGGPQIVINLNTDQSKIIEAEVEDA